MSEKKIFEMLGDIDEKYIDEAKPRVGKDGKIKTKKQKNPKKFNIPWLKWASVAVGCVLVLAIIIPNFIKSDLPKSEEEFAVKNANLGDFLAEPQGDYSLVERAIKENGFQSYYFTEDDVEEEESPGSSVGSSQSGENYEETTDNQEKSIIEGDLIKRSNKYIYYFDGGTLNVFSIKGTNSEKVGLLEIKNGFNGIAYSCQMFLSEDCSKIILINNYYDDGALTDVILIDVSDATCPNEIKRVTVSGNCFTARKTNGELYLFCNYYFYIYEKDFENPDWFDEDKCIPYVERGEEKKFINPQDIIIPDEIGEAPESCYAVVTKLDENTLDIKRFTAILSYNVGNVYMSENCIYLTRTVSSTCETDAKKIISSQTEITPILYKNKKFKQLKSVTVDGIVNSQYNLDEYDSKLRVVTTVHENHYIKVDETRLKYEKVRRNASLFVIEMKNMKTVASKESFAPDGEDVKSVRCNENYVYVCTAIRKTDPVFFFDLTDINDIKVKDTGTISGFSTSLVDFGGGNLLGIGVGDGLNATKVEVYRESQNGVESVCSYQITAAHSTDYKAYYIDRENQMIGMGLSEFVHPNHISEYVLLKFEKGKIYEVIRVKLNGGNYIKRGVLIDGCFYMFGENDFKVVEI